MADEVAVDRHSIRFVAIARARGGMERPGPRRQCHRCKVQPVGLAWRLVELIFAQDNQVCARLAAAVVGLAVTVASSRQPAGSNYAAPPDAIPPLPAAGAKPDGVDALLDRLGVIRAQKAALEKAEQETVNRLKEVLQQQDQRLRDLGVIREEADRPVTAVSPPRTGPTWGEAIKGK